MRGPSERHARPRGLASEEENHQMTTTVEAPAATPRDVAKPPLTTGQRLNRWDVKYSPYLYVAPFFILFGLVGLFPLLYTFVVSLNDWDLLKGPGEWVGFENYLIEFAVTDSVVAHDDDVGMLAHRRFTTTPGG